MRWSVATAFVDVAGGIVVAWFLVRGLFAAGKFTAIAEQLIRSTDCEPSRPPRSQPK